MEIFHVETRGTSVESWIIKLYSPDPAEVNEKNNPKQKNDT